MISNLSLFERSGGEWKGTKTPWRLCAKTDVIRYVTKSKELLFTIDISREP